MSWVDVPQNSTDWLRMRAGCVSASRVSDVVAKTQKGESEYRTKYKLEKAAEILSGLSSDNYVSPAMEWGIDNEPLARAAYEHKANLEVEPGGMYIHDRIGKFVASPDGRIGPDGLLEAKCPTSKTHLETLLSGEIPAKYQLQMLGQMSCSGRQWVDFVSFDPRLPKKMQLFVKRFNRDEGRISELEAAVEKFLDEVGQILLRLMQDDPASLEVPLRASLEEVSK